jgi:hypothetical protein
MSAHNPEPVLSEQADAVVLALDRKRRKKLGKKLQQLADGEIDGAAIRDVSPSGQLPPWQALRISDGIEVAFRRRTDEERGSDPEAPQLIVIQIAPPERFEEELRKLAEEEAGEE